MRSIGAPLTLAVMLAGCGSTTTRPAPATTGATRAAAAAGATQAGDRSPLGSAPAGAPNRTFVVALRGSSRAAANTPGAEVSLSARLRVLGSRDEICWTFSHVVGLRTPTSAHINSAARLPSAPGFTVSAILAQLGAHYAPTGCVPVTAGIVSEIAGGPDGSRFLIVDSRDLPANGFQARF